MDLLVKSSWQLFSSFSYGVGCKLQKRKDFFQSVISFMDTVHMTVKFKTSFSSSCFLPRSPCINPILIIIKTGSYFFFLLKKCVLGFGDDVEIVMFLVRWVFSLLISFLGSRMSLQLLFHKKYLGN